MFFKKMEEFKKVVREIGTEEILIDPGRFRMGFDRESLASLADSIGKHGVIEPLIVRYEGGLYHLIAGERRLRAAELAGLRTVPCISVAATQIEAAVIAVIENLHREDLNMFEEAAAIRSLIELGDMTQEVCARRLSVSQSYVANKLRLLRFTEEEKGRILEGGLSERHARALLRLDPGERQEVMEVLIERQMNVASAEEYIEDLLCAAVRRESREAPQPAEKRQGEQRHKLILKDIRLFYNSIDHAVDVIKKSGIPVEASREETTAGTLISILLRKAE